MNRKEFLKTSFFASGSVLLGSTPFFSGCGRDHTSPMPPKPIPVIEGNFNNEWTTIQPTSSSSTLKAQYVNQEIKGLGIISGLGFQEAGHFGPMIVANKGELANLTLKNQLDEGTNIHWHGLKVPSSMDGHPHHLAASGGQINYNFEIKQRAGLSWYHPHPHRKTGKQVFKGLAGLFLIRDQEEAIINLPSGDQELFLIIHDKRIENRDIHYLPTMQDWMAGYMGNRVLVNNTWCPVKEVMQNLYRIRILNGSNARIYNLALSNNQNFYVIGNDGGLLESSEQLTEAMLGPGERLDLLIDFKEIALNQSVFLVSKTFNGGSAQGTQAFNIMRFFINKPTSTPLSLPSGPLSILTNPGASVATRSFDISNIHQGHNMNGGMMTHTINGKSFEMNRVDEIVAANSTETWIFNNSGGAEPHPMHLHGVFFQIVGRSGGRGTILPFEKGWKDTVLVMPGETVTVKVFFENYSGTYLFHCHNLEHEDSGMMLQYEVV